MSPSRDFSKFGMHEPWYRNWFANDYGRGGSEMRGGRGYDNRYDRDRG